MLIWEGEEARRCCGGWRGDAKRWGKGGCEKMGEGGLGDGDGGHDLVLVLVSPGVVLAVLVWEGVVVRGVGLRGRIRALVVVEIWRVLAVETWNVLVVEETLNVVEMAYVLLVGSSLCLDRGPSSPTVRPRRPHRE